jgi:hypothetical protein
LPFISRRRQVLKGTLMTRTIIQWTVVSCLLCTPAFGQRRVFMTLNGQQGSAPLTGSTTIVMDPGSTVTIMAWLHDTGPAGELNAYQLILPYVVPPQGLASGTMTYVDINPGAPGGNSIFIDTSRPDWVFDDQIVTLPVNYNETPGSGIFGLFYATLQGFFTNPAGAGIRYLAQFQMQASADACGAFVLEFNVTTPPLTSFFNPNGGPFPINEYQPLNLIVRPQNDVCNDAQVAVEGDTPLCTVLSDAQPDVWFQFDPLCNGPVTVSTCNQADYNTSLEVYAGCGICPPVNLVASNDNAAGCAGGTSQLQFTASAAVCYTIRVLGTGSGAGSGILSIDPNSCFIGGVCQASGTINPANGCQICTPTQSATDWSPRPNGTPCTSDGNQCTTDACNGAGTCAHPPLPSGTACASDGVDCTLDQCNGAGTCAHPPAPVGTACVDTDGNPCTIAQCNGAGACANPAPNGAPCPDDGNVCTTNQCNGSGTCVALANGLPCSDGLFCNGSDTCGGGSCALHSGDPCAPGVCNEVSDTCTACDENSDCPDDGNPCTNAVCQFGSCVHVPNSAPCSDGLFCNGADFCSGGSCSVHAGNPCVGGPACANVCSEAGDTCNLPAGTPCAPDANECTLDQCNGAGMCAHPASPPGTPCTPDTNECTLDECDGAAACAHPASPPGTVCTDDGNPCTDDACNGLGTCAHPAGPAGTPCADEGNECTFDECNGLGGCAHPPVPAGAPCDDGLPCTGTGEPGVGFDECDGAGDCSGSLDPSCADTCADAAVAFEGTNLANNTGFGTELQVSCVANSTGDTWFVHVANCDGLMRVTTTGSDFDTVLSAYAACGGPELDCDDDDGPGSASAVVISVQAGQDYFFRVAGFNDAFGNVLLNIRRLDTCFVDGQCYDPGDANPANPCLICDPDEDPSGWAPALRGTACGLSIPSNPQCDSPDSCNGQGVCEPNNKPAGIACGDQSTTECDNADTCNGLGACADNFAAPGTGCGDPADTACDNPDSCDGAGACQDNFELSGMACGNLADTQCDNPDSCDGAGICLDNFEPLDFACGDPADTDCDDPDSCDGAGLCLSHFEAAGVFCGDPADTDCNNPDSCDGTGFCLSNFELPGLACGDPAMTECDNPDSCDAIGNCQPNYQLMGVSCGDPASTPCDNPDACDGAGMCADNFAGLGTPCGSPLNTDCDNPDICDGLGACDPNSEAAGVACGDLSDSDCNHPDSCDGSGSCDENLEAAGTACGDPGSSDCDNPDSCDSLGGCQPNFELGGAPCGSSADGDCDNPDSCDGAGACLDNFEPLGLGCGDPGNTDCDNPDTCDGAGDCQDNLAPTGEPCGDPSDLGCNNPDTCDGTGICVDNMEPGCTACVDFTDCGDADNDGVSDDNCMWYECNAGACSSIARTFADMGGQFGTCPVDGTTDNNDVFHALNCFADQDTDGLPPYPCEPNAPFSINVDAGGQFGNCCPDGVCDGNDAFHALNTFQGFSTCSCPDACPDGPSPASKPRVVASAGLVLRTPRGTIQPGETIQVEVHLEGPLKNLRGYQLHLAAAGGERGRLDLVDINIDGRPGHVFNEQGFLQAYNARTWQMFCGLTTPGLGTAGRTYLATFSLRASADAAGTFTVDLLHDDASRGRTFLFPTEADGKIAIERTIAAKIRVTGEERKQAQR